MPVPNNIIRWDRLQLGLIGALETAVTPAQVGWAYGEGTYDRTFPGDIVNLTIVGGPSPSISQGSFGVPLHPYERITITVDFANVGQRYVVEINDQSFFYDAVLGDDVDDIRTALLGLLNASPEYNRFEAEATLVAGEFTIEPEDFGDVWQAAIPAGAMTGTAVLSDEAALLTRTRKTVSIQVECFSKNRTPRDGAWALAGRVEAALQSPRTIEYLAQFNIALWGKGSAIDLSAIAGGHWESRVGFPITVALQSVLVEPVDQIDIVNLTVLGSDPSLSTTVVVERP